MMSASVSTSQGTDSDSGTSDTGRLEEKLRKGEETIQKCKRELNENEETIKCERIK